MSVSPEVGTVRAELKVQSCIAHCHAFVRELAQQLLQRAAIGIFEAELASDLPSPDLAGIGADEGDDGLG